MNGRGDERGRVSGATRRTFTTSPSPRDRRLGRGLDSPLPRRQHRLGSDSPLLERARPELLAARVVATGRSRARIELESVRSPSLLAPCCALPPATRPSRFADGGPPPETSHDRRNPLTGIRRRPPWLPWLRVATPRRPPPRRSVPTFERHGRSRYRLRARVSRLGHAERYRPREFTSHGVSCQLPAWKLGFRF